MVALHRARLRRHAVNYKMMPTVPSRTPISSTPVRGNQVWLKVGGAVLAALLIVALVYVVQKPNPVRFGAVAVLSNVDIDVAANGLDLARDDVTQSARSLADRGGGSLVIVQASGGPAQVVASADLRIERDGQPEHDSAVQARVAKDRVDQAFATAEATALSGQGRNLISLLAQAEALKPPPGQPYDIYYVGFGLGTVDPADARVPNLSGAVLHLVFPAAAGPQPPLNSATSAWRKEYWAQLAKATGATVAGINERNSPAPAAPGSPAAPVIPNLPDPTAVPTGTPKKPPAIPTPNPSPVVLARSTFQGDSPFFVHDDLATSDLSPLAAAWKASPSGFGRADCVGRTEAIGPDATAVTLSQQRADRAADLLRSMGIPSVEATGVGFRNPLLGIPPTDPQQRTVTCQLVPKSS
jgi:outer membrane protein OmpA-like peptidoglycan-associated protein